MTAWWSASATRRKNVPDGRQAEGKSHGLVHEEPKHRNSVIRPARNGTQLRDRLRYLTPPLLLQKKYHATREGQGLWLTENTVQILPFGQRPRP